MASRERGPGAYRVLERGVTRDLFHEAAGALGLVQQRVWEPATQGDSYEEVWSTPDQTTAMNYVEDARAGLPFVWVRGKDVPTWLDRLFDRVSYFWPEELLERAYLMHEHDEQVTNLYRLAITFPEYDPAVLEIFREFAINAPHPLLRRAALEAMAYRAWPESRQLVEQVAAGDADPAVRQHAAELLAGWTPPSGAPPA